MDSLGRCLADIQNEVGKVFCGIIGKSNVGPPLLGKFGTLQTSKIRWKITFCVALQGNIMLGNISPEQAAAEEARRDGDGD